MLVTITVVVFAVAVVGSLLTVVFAPARHLSMLRASRGQPIPTKPKPTATRRRRRRPAYAMQKRRWAKRQRQLEQRYAVALWLVLAQTRQRPVVERRAVAAGQRVVEGI